MKLKWSENNVWESNAPLITNKPFFKYKYLILDTKEIEDGMDRLAELR